MKYDDFMSLFGRSEPGESPSREIDQFSKEPDLYARSSQARSTINPEAMQIGDDIYRSIVDEHDIDELRRFQRLAALSEAGVRPVLVVDAPPLENDESSYP